MSEALVVEQVLARAKEQEAVYDWLGGAESYKRALDSISQQDFSRIGEIQERLGYAHYRGAMQADSRETFNGTIGEAVASYEKAKGFYEKVNNPGRSLRCDAMITYLRSWLSSEAAGKKRLIDESWRLAGEALRVFQETGDAWEYLKTYNQLSMAASFAFALEWSFPAREKMVREAVEYGERAIRFLSTSGDAQKLASAYSRTATYLDVFSFLFRDQDERESYSQRVAEYFQRANELSEEMALLELSNYVLLGTEPFVWALSKAEGIDKANSLWKRALDYGRKTRDRFLVGAALDWLALHTFWIQGTVEDPDERAEHLGRALQYAKEAKNQYSSIGFISSRAGVLWVEVPHAEYYWELSLFETDHGLRRGLLEKSQESAVDQLRRAENSGYPEVVSLAYHVFAKVLAALAKTEKDSEEKRRLLEEALGHRNQSIRLAEQLEPLHYWTRGVEHNYKAEIQSELFNLAKDPDNRKKLLGEALQEKETSLKLCLKWMATPLGAMPQLEPLGRWQDEYGRLLNRFHDFTQNRDDLVRAAEAFELAARSFGKLNLTSRVAECYWKLAQNYDALEEPLKAAEKFLQASDNYKMAAEKIPQLKDFYRDHALYMEAWSEIEEAKYHHGRQEYGSAEKFYKRASALHKSTAEWSFLAPNYSALAQVENGEDLSRKEQSPEAVHAFQQAAGLFAETKANLQAEIGRIENLDKKQMVESLIKGADLRREYCLGRVALEEAKILDRKGEHKSSSDRYGQAAEALEKITRGLEFEQGRRELKHIATLSRAWQMMARAEEEATPGLYLEASRLFEEAKELSLNEKARSLALGHSRFCRALEAGTRFADTGDLSLHAAAIQHLESASKHYLKAGFQDASEYAEATELLFDAYLHMDEAKKEKDQEKKTKLHGMAEKVLQAAAESFLKAQHPAKREQVLRLMEKVKKEKELAVSLSEVLHAPSFVSTTTTFTAPTPIREKAVGLERFEHADIQASLITRQKTLNVGEDLDLEIELVNAGRGPAQLVKVEEIVPEGFEVAGKPETYRVEDSYLNMKGRRLDPLKTEEVKMILKPKVQGQFTLKPRILYLDESGKYKSHEPEPIEVTVKELGISGWLKGR